MEAIDLHLQALVRILKTGKYQSSRELATTTFQLVEKYISLGVWKNARDLIQWLQFVKQTLCQAAVSETAPTNIIQMILKTIQEQFQSRHLTHDHAITFQMSIDSDILSLDYTQEIPELRSDILTAIGELSFELDSSTRNIAEDANKHIHTNDVVLTLGKSRTVETFLKRAAKKAVFEVIVSECAPFRHGHDLAKNLAKADIQTTLITDTAVFAMMSRVNKVVIGTHTVLANGGLKAIAGSHLVTLAAKYYNVPVIVLSPLYKLSPEYPRSHDFNIQNRFVSPEALVDYSDGNLIDKVQIYNPLFDYVPPELISLFIFNIGSHAPSYIYRLLHETYPSIDEENISYK